MRDAGPGALPAERHTSLNCIELGVIGFGIRQKSLIVRRSTEKQRSRNADLIHGEGGEFAQPTENYLIA